MRLTFEEQNIQVFKRTETAVDKTTFQDNYGRTGLYGSVDLA